ncbi:MAG: hypothetical protein AAFU85_24445 [Planctomycetota bacterium]
MSELEKINPYQATVALADDSLDRSIDDQEPATLTRTALRWFGICSFSALPSFFIAASQSSPLFALILGISVFACGYTALDYYTATSRFRKNRRVSRTLRITYGTRIVITILFPIAVWLDIMCGIASITIADWLFGGGQIEVIESFGGAFFTTILQGLVMNLVLAIYAILVYAIQTLFAPFSAAS